MLFRSMLVGSVLLARLEKTPPPATPTQAVAERPTATPFLPTLTPQPTRLPATGTRPPSLATDETPTPEAETHTATPTPAGIASPTATCTGTGPPAPTYPPAATLTPAQPPPPKPVCQHPPSWIVYTVQRGDTLAELAQRFDTTTLALMQGNCLGTSALYAGQRLYVPHVVYPTATPEPTPCGPPPHWVVYVVQPGDTLYALSRRFNVAVEVLRWANCLDSHDIYLGQTLYVPPLPPTPLPTASVTLMPTPSPTGTRIQVPTPTRATPKPTATPSPTLPPAPTATIPSPVPSSTPSPTLVPATIAPTPTFPATTILPATIAPTESPTPSP